MLHAPLFFVSYSSALPAGRRRNGLPPASGHPPAPFQARLSPGPQLSLYHCSGRSLFVDAVNKELVCNKKILVNRRGSAINPLPRKLAEDIWTLTDCLKHKKLVPWVILKNGKRDRKTFENIQSTQPIQPTQSPMRIPMIVLSRKSRIGLATVTVKQIHLRRPSHLMLLNSHNLCPC